MIVVNQHMEMRELKVEPSNEMSELYSHLTSFLED